MEDLEKRRTFRDRKTYTRKDKYVEKELHHPLHEPYKRMTQDVLKNIVEEESDE